MVNLSVMTTLVTFFEIARQICAENPLVLEATECRSQSISKISFPF